MNSHSRKVAVILLPFVLVTLASCGREQRKEEEANLPGNETSHETDRNRAAAGPILMGLVNSMSGIVQSLVLKDKPELTGLQLGEALPHKGAALQLRGCKSKSSSFTKEQKSFLGLNLVRITYEISYDYGCNWQGKGNYLVNVRFLPRSVSIDPLWGLEVSGLSNAPINRGTGNSPIAELSFALTFHAKGVGAQIATDTFKINAQSGELSSDIRAFGG